MPVQIPPWIAIDPIEPARIELQAKRSRAANAAAERRAALEEQRLYMQQQAMYARLAAQERADQRREQVLRETRDAQLAQQAAALEFRRAMAAQNNERQLRQLRMREQQIEQQTAAAARQLKGMRSLQADLEKMPLEQALAKNAADLFSGRPERGAEALRRAQPIGPPQEFTTPGGIKGVYNARTGTPSFPPRLAAELGPEAFRATEITDAEGRPMGVSAIPGRGAARLLPGHKGLTPEGRVNALKARLAILKNLINYEADTPAKEKELKAERDDIMKQLKEMTDLPERLPGKEDERADEDMDFLLPPTGEDEESLEEGAGEEEAMDEEDIDEEALAEEEPDEEQLAMEEF